MSGRHRATCGFDFINAATDAEILALLLRVLKPSIVAALRHVLLEQFSALEACLAQHEGRLAAIAEFPNKSSLLKEIRLAQELCAHIQADICRTGDGVAAEPGPDITPMFSSHLRS